MNTIKKIQPIYKSAQNISDSGYDMVAIMGIVRAPIQEA